jgi:2-polyprenyl-3-methyl-5-hydroxy-6-metoxy-1,4-benzoquinol methylase
MQQFAKERKMASQSSQSQPRPTPELIHDTLNAYQKTAALKAAIELDIFTAIGEGADTVAALAKRCGGTQRGVRILCDYLTILGLLKKQAEQYALTPDSGTFLDRRSPMCIASTAQFLTRPEFLQGSNNLAEAIRKGQPAQSLLSDDNPIWVEFARSMAAMQRPAAEEIARLLDADAGKPWKVLDVAAGHGVFGIALAKHNPNAEIYSQDWGNVLGVAAENARAAGVGSRFHTLPGSAFDIDLGSAYDVVLITNFLHHFDPPTNEKFLRRVREVLAPGGRAVTVDFVPDEDRLTPARAASFSMTMLLATPAGDAYPFSEYQRMFQNVGFSSNELHRSPSGQSAIISRV